MRERTLEEIRAEARAAAAARAEVAARVAAQFASWVISRQGHRPAFEEVSTDQLREGDLIKLHGYVFRLGEREVYYSHSTEREVYAFEGYPVQRPASADSDWMVDGVLKAHGTWRIQGNSLARWARIGRVL